MFNLTISIDFIAATMFALTVFLIFFIPFFRNLLFSKKELHLRCLLEHGASYIKDIIEYSYELPIKYLNHLSTPMVRYCTKIFEASNGDNNMKVWIIGINSIKGTKIRRALHEVLIEITKNAILDVSSSKLADTYFEHMLKISDPDYNREDKPEDCGLVEDFIWQTILHDHDDRGRQEFITALKQKKDQWLEDNKETGKVQEVLLEAEILKIERSFFQR